MRVAERIARAESIIAALKKDPELTTERLAARFNCSRDAVGAVLRAAGMKAGREVAMGTILTGTHGFSAVVKKYSGGKT